jgi:membrane dipeptidase
VSQAFDEWSRSEPIGPRPRVTVDDVVAHFERAREVCGIDHIGMGSDYDGFDQWLEAMSHVREGSRCWWIASRRADGHLPI